MQIVKKQINEKSIIYQAKSGAIELSVDAKKETIWANLNQIAGLFGVQKSAISKHFKNIFESGELLQKATVSKMETVGIEGKRQIRRSIEIYNLDAIIAVGYRVNSKKATQFRIWATKIIKEYVSQGYVINPMRIAQNYQKFLSAVEETKKLLPIDNQVTTQDALELIRLFARTWFSLDAYDRQYFPNKNTTKKKIAIASDELAESISKLKKELIQKREATEIFSVERNIGSLAGIIGNVFQTFGGKDLYPTIEEKAVHLLYFIVKNHPFIDGNKRSGAFAFIWFMQKANLNFKEKITPEALTALTLLVAESNPKDKDRLIGLVLLLLKK